MSFIHISKCKKICIPKKDGSSRILFEPPPDIKQEQRIHLEQVIYKTLHISPFATGFRLRSNIVSNAIPHVGKKYILKTDIKDFFTSCSWTMFKYSYEDLCTVSKKCSISNLDEFTIHFLEGYKSFPVLAQGFPASPAIANFIASALDYSIAKYLNHLQNYLLENSEINSNFSFTRYADDITISGNVSREIMLSVYKKVKKIVDYYGFSINTKKTRIIPYYRRQIVTGIIVNQKINLPRELRKRIRAMKHHVETGRKPLDRHIQGYFSYKNQVDNFDLYIPPSIQEYFDSKDLSETLLK